MREKKDHPQLDPDQVPLILRRGLKLEANPPPFFTQRVLAQLQSRREQKKLLRWWKWAALLSPAFSLAAVVLVLQLNTSMFEGSSLESQAILSQSHRSSDPITDISFSAEINKAYAVKVEMAELDSLPLASVQILLPEGVSFFSREYPELQDKNSLELDLDHEWMSETLPFVISSSTTGLKRILIRFFDSEQNLVSERSVNIDFASETQDKKREFEG